MSRTRKKIPFKVYRSPRGVKQATINNARKGAIPPDAWEDIPHDSQCQMPYKIARKLHKKGLTNEEIVEHIRRKFGCTREEACHVIPYKSQWWYRCGCPRCDDAKAAHTTWRGDVDDAEDRWVDWDDLREEIGLGDVPV